MLALKVLESSDTILLLSSFLYEHACWTLRRVARNVLSYETAPCVRRALSWRQELGQFFALLEGFLSSRSLQSGSYLVSLQDIRDSFASSPYEFSLDLRLGQLLSVAGELLVSCNLKSGEPGIGQRRSDGRTDGVHDFVELCARCLRLESKLATITEDLACNQVPSKVLPIGRPSRRRLSRQSSVALPKGVPLQQYTEQMKSYVNAKALKLQCERWISVVQGAESALTLLQQLFCKGGAVTVDKVVQILKSSRSTLRPKSPLLAESVPAALLLLISRTGGGLTVESVKKSCQQDRACFQDFQGDSSTRAKKALSLEHATLRRRHRQFATDTKQAFMATLPRGNGISISDDTEDEMSPA